MAKNKSHEDEIKAGLAALRNFGVAVDAPAADLVPQLKTQFGKGRETDLAAIFSLGKIFDPAAVEALGEIDRQTTDKDLKKEIKRSRFKLAQKGLVAPQEKAADTKPAAIFERVADVEASMSAVDGGGGRLIWITKPQPNHGLQVIQAMLHDREGLLRFGGMHVRRKELRKMADYPHADSTFPHSEKVAADICTQAGLNEEERYKLLRGNAITAFGLERFGITS